MDAIRERKVFEAKRGRVLSILEPSPGHLGHYPGQANRIRGSFRAIAQLFVEAEYGIPLANSKGAVAKGNS